MSSAFSIDFLEPTSEIQTPVTFLWVDKNTKCGCSFSKIAWKILVIKLSKFAEIFTFYSCSYGFSFGQHCTLSNVIITMTYCANLYDVFKCKKSVTLKIVYNKKKIQNFLSWICNLFHLVKRENVYFICGFATHEISIFRFTRWNKWHIHSKNLNILYVFVTSPCILPHTMVVMVQINHGFCISICWAPRVVL